MSQSYSYDSASRLASVSSGNVSAAYSRISGSSLLSGITANYSGNTVLGIAKTYDSSNRLTSITSTFGTKTISRSYMYNTVDHRTKSQAEDGTAWNYSYDGKGQVTGARKATVIDNRTIPGFIYQYGYDDIGNLNAETRNGSMFEYTANSLNQYTRRTIPGKVDISGYAIPEAKVRIQKGTAVPTAPVRTNGYFFQQYNLDNSTNPVEEIFKVYAVKNESTKDIVSVQTLNVYIPKTPQTPSYDADGNMLSDGVWTCTWNAENRLTAAERTGKEKHEFSYDYLGRRTAHKTYNWSGDTWTLTSHVKFVYDGWNCIAALDGSTNVVLKTYVWGEDLSGSLQGAGGVGGLLAETNSSGTFFPAYNGNGDILAYAGTDGKTAANYEYDAFGRLISKSGALADTFAYRFSTKPWDGIGYNYTHREYLPDLKRWASRDPIGEPGGSNIYAFARNSPTNGVDYLGLRDLRENEVAILDRLTTLAEKYKDKDDELKKAILAVVADIKKTIASVNSGNNPIIDDPLGLKIGLSALDIWADEYKSSLVDAVDLGYPTCNKYVANAITISGLDSRLVQSKYILINRRPSANEWGDPSLDLGIFRVIWEITPIELNESKIAVKWESHKVQEPKFGDIIAFPGGHMGHSGIYLGQGLYISTTTTDPLKVQQSPAIIKFVNENMRRVYRSTGRSTK